MVLDECFLLKLHHKRHQIHHQPWLNLYVQLVAIWVASIKMVPCTKLDNCSVHMWVPNWILNTNDFMYVCEKREEKGGGPQVGLRHVWLICYAIKSYSNN
jgi:hypothetical protein